MALPAYLACLRATGDHAAAVVRAAEAVAADPWRVVETAGLLARCEVVAAAADIGLTCALRTVRPGHHRAIATLSRGALYPVPVNAGRSRRGAFDTPRDIARNLVAATLAAAGGATTGLDPACGTGAFLVALTEAGVPRVLGTDFDPLAVAVARVAAPRAEVGVADALDPVPRADVVVGNPPFVPPERQDHAARIALRGRFPWLRGRFDLVVPFAAVAVDRADRAAGLLLPAPALVQPYGAPLRERWLRSHAVVRLGEPQAFPGAAVQVVEIVLDTAHGPGPVLPYGVEPAEILGLPGVPLTACMRPGDGELAARVRSASIQVGDLCLVDTGLVAHGPHGGRDALVADLAGAGRVPYADARGFFAGQTRWLDYRPEVMHRAKSPSMFEEPKIVVQRLRGRGPVRAAVDRRGVYVGHTCTVVQPRDARVPIDRLLDLVLSPLVDGLTRIERGRRLDLYPRDVRAFPVPTAWLDDASVSLADAWCLTSTDVARLTALSG